MQKRAWDIVIIFLISMKLITSIRIDYTYDPNYCTP